MARSRPTAGATFARVVRGRAIPSPRASVLTWCARPTMPEALVAELQRRVGQVADWDALLGLAEQHGMGPLLYEHLVRGHLDIPSTVERQLLGVYVRHRQINSVMFRALGEILDALHQAKVEAIVLKGPAIADLIYGNRGLRPCSDLDVLVREIDALPTQRVLGRLGYNVQLPTSAYRMSRHHHLRAASRVVDGVSVLVEVHRDALSADRAAPMTFERQRDQAATLVVDGRDVLCFEPTEMLWHLCRHLAGLWHPFRLIWIADIIGYAERRVDDLDWKAVRERHPFVISTLELVDGLTPLPERLVERAGLERGRVPERIGEDYDGWPRATAMTWDDWAGRRAFLRRTLDPPEWWARLNYGTGIGPSGHRVAKRRHLATLGGVIQRRVVDFLPRRDQKPADTGG